MGVAAGLMAGCAANPDASDPLPQDALPTYHQDVAPILARYCSYCHYPGGIAPFSLGDYQSAQEHREAIHKAVASGTMPPWMPSEAGLPLRYSLKMRQQDRDLLLRWVEGGALAGDPQLPARTDIPAKESVEWPHGNFKLDPGAAYLPKARVSDDYRCFVVKSELPADTYVQAGMIQPDQVDMVHHVVVFQVPPAGAPQVRELERKNMDGQPGYDCFGGAGAVGDTRVLLTWAPGSVPLRFPSGTAVKIGAGSLVVMQVHYNLLNSHGVADRTQADLEVSAAPPEREAQIWPLADPSGLFIKAGDANAKQVITLPVGLLQSYYKMPRGDILVYGNGPHMHLRGTRVVTSVEEGPILLEIPRWNFHWQLGYQFREPYRMRPQDTFVVECDFDNSFANQPVVDGQRQPPQDLKWGESTKDEMCVSFLYVAPAPQ